MLKLCIKATQIIKFIFTIILSMIFDFCFLKVLSLTGYEEWLLEIKKIFETVINNISLHGCIYLIPGFICLVVNAFIRLFSIIGIIMTCLSIIPNTIIDIFGFGGKHKEVNS